MAPVKVQMLGARVAVVNARPRNVQARAIDYGNARRTSPNVDATQRRSAAQRASRSPHARAAYTPPPPQPSSYSSSSSSYSSSSYSNSYSSTPSGKANPIDYGAARRSAHTVNPVTRMSAAQRASRSPHARATYTPPQASYEAPSSYSSSSYSSSSYSSTPSGKANPIDYGAARRSSHSVDASQRTSAAQRRSRSPVARSSYTPPSSASYDTPSYSAPASYTPSGKANPIDYGAARRSGGRSRSPTARSQASRSYSAPPPSSYSSDSYSSSSSYSSASYTASGKANPVDYGASRRSQSNINPVMRNSAAQRAARRSSAGNNSSGGFW